MTRNQNYVQSLPPELLEFKQTAVGRWERYEGPISSNTTKGVLNAINERRLVQVLYSGDKLVKAGYHYIEIYVYGLSKFTKNHLIRAFDYDGGWKLFRLDRIRSIKVIKVSQPFTKPKPGYSAGTDKDLSEIILRVTFKK